MEADVRDRLMRGLIGEVDAVFRLAAVALVHDAYRNPLVAYYTNSMGTAAVLEAIRLCPGRNEGSSSPPTRSIGQKTVNCGWKPTRSALLVPMQSRKPESLCGIYHR